MKFDIQWEVTDKCIYNEYIVCSKSVNPVYHFPKDRKYITFTSREEDEMKSHDLTNLVSARLEEERTSTAAPLKL